VAAQQAGTHHEGDTENSTLEKPQDRKTLVVVGDVTGEEDVRRLFDATIAAYGGYLLLKL
jgi:hypothetical protein